MKIKHPDPRDDPQNWIAADQLLTQAEAEWYARMWRDINARIENREPDRPDTGLTRLERYKVSEN